MPNETTVAILSSETSRFIQLAKPFEKFFKVSSGKMPLKEIKKINKYLSIFALPDKDGKCLKCGTVQDGLMAQLMGGFVYGFAHGEGGCSKCKWPARANHYDVGLFKSFVAILQYHPKGIKRELNKKGD